MSVVSFSTRVISSAICTISGSFMPCVVTDGVPIRRPEVTNGDLGSSGTVFLLSVMPASSSAFWASLPVSSSSNVRRSISIRWFSVPPETRRKPRSPSASASAAALATIWRAYSPNSGDAASPKATALPAITCSSGPPWRPGKIALSIAAACSERDTMHPPRGPRSVLCVVKVTTSAYGTGLGCAPPAMSPAMWAASNRKRAPTSSQISRIGAGSMIRG